MSMANSTNQSDTKSALNLYEAAHAYSSLVNRENDADRKRI